jgi:hypothetical protein
MSNTDTPPPSRIRPDRRTLQTLARSLARDLDAQGFEPRVLIMLASELIEEASQRIRVARETPGALPRRAGPLTPW